MMSRLAVFFSVFCGCLALAQPACAQTLTTLHSFCADFPSCPDGSRPLAGIVQDSDGSFYGATTTTLFKITAAGKLTTLHTFCSQPDCSDGGGIVAGPIQGRDGSLYGTTFKNGLGNFSGPYQGGTIFKLTHDGTFTTLYNFCNQGTYPVCPDGGGPWGLVQAKSGELYGVTNQYGAVGAWVNGAQGYGTVFKISPEGVFITLHTFCVGGSSAANCADGAYPYTLIQATDGNFYGTTHFGGANGQGTIFKMTASGKLTTLHSFCMQAAGTKCLDGASPAAGLLQASDGYFYGTTQVGGSAGVGTLFRMDTSGAFTLLYSFCARGQPETNCPDGSIPAAAPMQASDGNIYGTTNEGGVIGGCGTVFGFTPASSIVLQTVHTFCTVTLDADGANSDAPLVQGTDGKLYGTAEFGGVYEEGDVFSISLGLLPIVETTTSIGSVGASVKILGNALKGTSSVAFNGVLANFSVVSNTNIKATVPVGATSGFVEVTTPAGTLRSRTVFSVKP